MYGKAPSQQSHSLSQLGGAFSYGSLFGNMPKRNKQAAPYPGSFKDIDEAEIVLGKPYDKSGALDIGTALLQMNKRIL